MGRGEQELEDENGVRLLTFKDWLLGLAQAYPIGYDEGDEQDP